MGKKIHNIIRFLSESRTGPVSTSENSKTEFLSGFLSKSCPQKKKLLPTGKHKGENTVKTFFPSSLILTGNSKEQRHSDRQEIFYGQSQSHPWLLARNSSCAPALRQFSGSSPNLCQPQYLNINTRCKNTTFPSQFCECLARQILEFATL